MPDEDELDLAIRQARDTGDQLRLRKLEQKKSQRHKEKERLKLDVLKQQLAQQGEQQEKNKTMTTQTRAQEEKSEVLTAQDKPTPEQQIKDAKRKEDAQEESQEYQREPG